MRLPGGALLCQPDEIARLAGDLEPTQARVLLFAFEEAGLVRRGPDCTLEATVLLNRTPDEIIATLTDPAEQALAAGLFTSLGAAADRQVTYRATDVSARAGLDPRAVDPLLTRLAGQELLIYRPYARGVTLTPTPGLADPEQLRSIEGRFADRYQLFEARLHAMLDYVHLRPGQGRCRSAHLVNYLTGRSDTPPCGKCDLCSPTSESLPWDPGVRLYGQPVAVDVRLAILGAVRDHDGWFGRWTVERMLLGIPQTNTQGGAMKLPPPRWPRTTSASCRAAGPTSSGSGGPSTCWSKAGSCASRSGSTGPAATSTTRSASPPRGATALAGGVELPECSEEAA